MDCKRSLKRQLGAATRGATHCGK